MMFNKPLKKYPNKFQNNKLLKINTILTYLFVETKIEIYNTQYILLKFIRLAEISEIFQ